MKSLFEAAQEALLEPEVTSKQKLTHLLEQSFHAGETERKPIAVEAKINAGYPEGLHFVSPKDLPRRRLGSTAGKVALLHALAHIEFNAINLALDAVYRFQEMPESYYSDWLSIAADEARHFALLQARLRSLGSDYGSLPVHAGLWEMAQETAYDVLSRMALVPRVMEARGLDVTPGMIAKLQEIDDVESAEILQLIWEEEIGHVAAGSRWFLFLCNQRDLEPETTYLQLLERHFPGRLRGPFHREARKLAGFTEAELNALETLIS